MEAERCKPLAAAVPSWRPPSAKKGPAAASVVPLEVSEVLSNVQLARVVCPWAAVARENAAKREVDRNT